MKNALGKFWSYTERFENKEIWVILKYEPVSFPVFNMLPVTKFRSQAEKYRTKYFILALISASKII